MKTITTGLENYIYLNMNIFFFLCRYNLQTRGGGNGLQDLKRSRHFRRPSTHGQNVQATPAQSGLLFRIENFFCLGSPLSVFLTLRWRDPQNQGFLKFLIRIFYNTFFNIS